MFIIQCIANPVKAKAARLLREEWRKEGIDIKKCIDCYYFWTTNNEDGRNNDYFTLVCTKPHLLVYVKESREDGSRKWPAKVLSVNGNKMVTIECFGDYLRGDYKFDECYLYSDAEKSLRTKAMDAEKSTNELKRAEFIRSFKVINIDLYRKWYDSF